MPSLSGTALSNSTLRPNRSTAVDEFFDAIAGSEERYELVEGIMRPLARANQGHNVIRSNVLAALAPSSKREGYRVTSVRTGPDAAAMTASSPVIVVDVLSADTSGSGGTSGCANSKASKASSPSCR